MLSDTPTFMAASCTIATSLSGCATKVERFALPVVHDTLPDLLRDALDVVFVGINPSLFSVARGHYFARRSNRFWPCFSRSVLSAAARGALGVERLEPEHDRALPAHGFGFTDLVKRASVRASDLEPQELAAGVAVLVDKLERYQPRIACFHGMTGYQHVLRELAPAAAKPTLGPQPLCIGGTRCFLVPNPSGANAHFTPADQLRWYDQLAEFAHPSRAA
jgi:TDG/mug DNA glycosylase family protein